MINLEKAPLSAEAMDVIEEQIQENLELSVEIVTDRVSVLNQMILERLFDDPHTIFLYKVGNKTGVAFMTHMHKQIGLDGYWDGGEYGDDPRQEWINSEDITKVEDFGSGIWRVQTASHEIWLQRVIVRLP